MSMKKDCMRACVSGDARLELEILLAKKGLHLVYAPKDVNFIIVDSGGVQRIEVAPGEGVADAIDRFSSRTLLRRVWSWTVIASQVVVFVGALHMTAIGAGLV